MTLTGWRRAWEIFRAYTANEEPSVGIKETEPLAEEDEWTIDTEAMSLESNLSHEYGEQLIERAAEIMRADGRTCITKADIRAAAMADVNTDVLRKCFAKQCDAICRQLADMAKLFEETQGKTAERHTVYTHPVTGETIVAQD